MEKNRIPQMFTEESNFDIQEELANNGLNMPVIPKTIRDKLGQMKDAGALSASRVGLGNIHIPQPRMQKAVAGEIEFSHKGRYHVPGVYSENLTRSKVEVRKHRVLENRTKACPTSYYRSFLEASNSGPSIVRQRRGKSYEKSRVVRNEGSGS